MSEKNQLWAEFAVLLGLIGLSTQSLSVLYATATFSGVLFYDTRRTLFSAKWIVPVLMGIWAILYLPMPWISSPYCYLVLAALLVGVFLYSGYSPRGITGVNPSAVSFWVFLLHWPVICSTSTRILLRYADRFWLGFWLSMTVTVFGVLAASLLLSKTFDVWVNRWLKTLKAKISGVSSGVHS